MAAVFGHCKCGFPKKDHTDAARSSFTIPASQAGVSAVGVGVADSTVSPTKLRRSMGNVYTEFPEFTRKQLRDYEKQFKEHDLQDDGFLDMMELKLMMEKLDVSSFYFSGGWVKGTFLFLFGMSLLVFPSGFLLYS